MSTQTIKERPLVTGLNTGRTLDWSKWVKTGRAKVMGHKKVAIVGVAAVAVVAMAALYFWGTGTSAPQYMTAKVERGNLRNTVTATGTLQAVTTVQVGSQASGTISALYADFNSVVKKGQVIAQLDPSVAKAQVDQSRANLQQARASLAAGSLPASPDLAPALAMRRQKRLPRNQQYRTNQSGVSSAQANLAVLKAQQDDALSFLKQQESSDEERRDCATRIRHRKHQLTRPLKLVTTRPWPN